MSAPPRSTVVIPRLLPAGTRDDLPGSKSPQGRSVPVGPGGGRVLSHALCLALVDLPTAVCAWLRLGRGAPILTKPLGLARALVAVARHVKAEDSSDSRYRESRAELDKTAVLSESELVRELTSNLVSAAWPEWVPPVAFAMPQGMEPMLDSDALRPPEPPDPDRSIANPLLAARVVSAIRGPVFLRDAAPALPNLLNLYGGATPSGAWELWLPFRTGTIRSSARAPANGRGEAS